MRGRRALLAGLVALGALALAVAALRGPSGAAPAPAAALAERAVAAEVWIARSEPVRDTVRTVGTLAANEAIEVVPELSRRLVSIDVTEGSEVEAGQRLFKLDDADLRAQLAELEARRQLAARTEERQRELLRYEKKALSQQAYDEAVAQLAEVEAQIAALRVTLDKTEIRAPFEARVGLRRVSEGAWVTPETVLTTLQDTSRIKIDFTLPERYAGAVTVGQPFTFQVAGRGRDFEGRVIAVEPGIDAATRSVRVRGISDNPDGALVPGAFASVEVPLAEAGEGILVPAQALVPSATGHAVWVLEDGRAALREVEIGRRTRDAVEVVRGLAVGDAVLTTNLLRLRAGAPVEPIRPEGGPG
ncbi:MAG TPA: efflux RND transporter periplasmic adaptor subunit [Myxococcota bacterium]